MVKAEIGREIEIAAFADMKTIISGGGNICRLFVRMTPAQILEVDRYDDGGNEKHELLELCDDILRLA